MKHSKLAQEFFYHCDLLNDARKQMEARETNTPKEGYHNGWLVGYRTGRYEAELYICCRLAAQLGLATQVYYSAMERRWIKI